jgi:large subunit ribosomal protein L29
MEIAKIRNMSDEELKHQEKTSGEQLFRLRFQVALGQNDGVKKLRELRKEIAQIKTIARERELGIHDDVKGPKPVAAEADEKPAKTEKPEHAAKAAKAHPATHAKAAKAKPAKAGKKPAAAKAKPKSAKKAAPTKTAKAKGKSK